MGRTCPPQGAFHISPCPETLRQYSKIQHEKHVIPCFIQDDVVGFYMECYLELDNILSIKELFSIVLSIVMLLSLRHESVTLYSLGIAEWFDLQPLIKELWLKPIFKPVT